MKVRDILIAGAVSCSFGSLAFAQQAQEAQPQQQETQPQQESQTMGQQGQAGQPQSGLAEGEPKAGQGQTEPNADVKAMKEGAHSPPETQYPQDTVRKVQQKLNDEGFRAGPVDGIWGPKTQSAVKNFQEKKGIEATGQLDEKTLAELDVEAQPMTGAAGEGAQEGAGPATGAVEQPGQEGAQQPAEQEAQQPGQGQGQSQSQ